MSALAELDAAPLTIEPTVNYIVNDGTKNESDKLGAIGDIDYTASAVLTRVIEHVHQRHVRFVVTTVLGPVRKQLDRYGISAALGPGAYYDTPGEALEAFHAAAGVSGE